MKLHLLFLPALLTSTVSMAQNLEDLCGGGNLKDSDTDTMTATKCSMLDFVHNSWSRLGMYPGTYNNGGKPTPSNIESRIVYSLQRGKKLMVLFEFYYNYYGPNDPKRDYTTWYNIGHDYATRFKPGSAFLTSQGLTNGEGVSYWSAINEPDIAAQLDFTEYYDMLHGLGDGIHSADPQAKVFPGGYANPNYHQDYTAAGYLSKIAPLINNGTLAGFDCHKYSDKQYAPIDNGVFNGGSMQYYLDHMKQTSGITVDCDFVSTEHNFKNSITGQVEGYDANYAERLYLVHLWDILGVVRPNGKGMDFALAWNVLHDGEDVYDMASSISPPVMNETGIPYKLVMDLARDMHFVSRDPKGTGVHVLQGNNKKMWVFMDINGWTNQLGSSFTVTNIPAGSTTLKVYRWNSTVNKPWQTLSLTGQTQYTLTGLSTGEAYMILAETAPSLCTASSAPVIDGIAESSWNQIQANPLNNFIPGPLASSSDISATYKSTWDNNNLYILVNVTDDVKKNDSGNNFWDDDAVELFIDGNNDKATSYDANDRQYIFRWNDNMAHQISQGGSSNPAGVTFAQTNTSNGYIMEISVAWSALGVTPSAAKLVGLDVHVDDDDDGGARDNKIAWYAEVDNSFLDPSIFGTIKLGSSPCASATGITADELSSGISIYPNPFSTGFTISISNETILHNAVMKIYDVFGKEVKTVSVTDHEIRIDRGELSGGVYFYSLINNCEKIANARLNDIVGQGKLIVQ